jgi:tetratricopeptide (TPR) repeat protein
MRLRTVAATLALSLGLAFGGAGGARAQAAAPADQATDTEQVARQHFQLGRAQYESGSFREAATSFERAYELSKREVLWYNIFLAYRDAGDNAKAAEALRNYLTRVEQIDTRAQLEARLASLERLVQEEEQRKQQQAQQQQQTPDSTSQEPAQEQTPQQQVADELALKPTAERSPSIVPYILMGVGGAMIIGGVVTGAMASSKHGELEDQCPDNRCDDPSLKSVADEGKTLALVADILLFGGIAAAGTGGVLWFLNNNQSSSEEAPVSAALSCGPRACGGRVGLRF